MALALNRRKSNVSTLNSRWFCVAMCPVGSYENTILYLYQTTDVLSVNSYLLLLLLYYMYMNFPPFCITAIPTLHHAERWSEQNKRKYIIIPVAALVCTMYCDVITEVYYVSINNPHAICVWPGFCLISIKVCSVLFWKTNGEYGNRHRKQTSTFAIGVTIPIHFP